MRIFDCEMLLENFYELHFACSIGIVWSTFLVGGYKNSHDKNDNLSNVI